MTRSRLTKFVIASFRPNAILLLLITFFFLWLLIHEINLEFEFNDSA